MEKPHFISDLLWLSVSGIHLVWNTYTHTHTHASVHLMCLMPLLFTGTHFHTFPLPGNTHSSLNVRNMISLSQRSWCRSSPHACRKAIIKCFRCCCTAWPIRMRGTAGFLHPAHPTCKHVTVVDCWKIKVWSSAAEHLDGLFFIGNFFICIHEIKTGCLTPLNMLQVCFLFVSPKQRNPENIEPYIR